MAMASLRIAFVVPVVTLAALIGSGCSSSSAEKGDVAATEASELTLSGTNYLGPIAHGETKTTLYSNPQRYRAYGFEAAGGDEITLDVTSALGDSIAWLTNENYEVIDYNDDAGIGYDAKIVYKVPEGRPLSAYRIVFRDYALVPANFSVKLTIDGPSACRYNATKCACNPAHEPWRTYVGTPQECMTIRYTCQAGWTTFQNACGCGCEH